MVGVRIAVLSASAALTTDMKKGMKGETCRFKGRQRVREEGRMCMLIFRSMCTKINPAFLCPVLLSKGLD